MTTFEEELSSLPVSQSTKYTEYWNKAQLLTVFKDWQPQQALPVVPEFVAEWIEHCKGMGYSLIGALTFKLSSTMHEELSTKILKWLGNEGNDETFALAFITGEYEVEEQMFYLRNKLTGMYLYKKPLGGYGEDPASYSNRHKVKNIFFV